MRKLLPRTLRKRTRAALLRTFGHVTAAVHKVRATKTPSMSTVDGHVRVNSYRELLRYFFFTHDNSAFAYLHDTCVVTYPELHYTVRIKYTTHKGQLVELYAAQQRIAYYYVKDPQFLTVVVPPNHTASSLYASTCADALLHAVRDKLVPFDMPMHVHIKDDLAKDFVVS